MRSEKAGKASCTAFASLASLQTLFNMVHAVGKHTIYSRTIGCGVISMV